MLSQKSFKRLSPYIWEIPVSHRKDMRVPARFYLSEVMLQRMLEEKSAEQLVNVATLPGIEQYALAMPDVHQGYGFPIGGVAALRTSDGVISPGGVGYDINCGVRLLASPVHIDEIQDYLVPLANQMQRDIPSGVGRGGRLKLGVPDIDAILNQGISWAIKKGFASPIDAEYLEEQGHYRQADASMVSDRAKTRGRDQVGTIGAGNHFVEVQVVQNIFDQDIAKAFGLFRGQVTVMIHTGSRGLGHQTCTDYVRLMNACMAKYHIDLPDRELACAPFLSEEGQQYFKAMAACANFAWTNRQLITHNTRQAWQRILPGFDESKLRIVYDVAHNIAKLETHGNHEYIVHRKGATRAFGPHSPFIPTAYQDVGQPVLIPGSMGTYSYVLAGTSKGMAETFGSCCHGAGRQMSRMRAKKTLNYQQLREELERYGVVVRAGSAKELLEEAPAAYKDIDEVINVVTHTGIAKLVAKMKPLAVIKG